MATGPISFRQDWHHTDGKALMRLEDSWDDLEGVTKVAMLSYDPVGLNWVPFTGIGGGGGGAGDASAANQVLELAKLTSIDGKTPALVGGRVPVDGSGVVQPVSGPLTDAQLRAAAVPGSNAAASQVDGHSATIGAKADAAWDLVAAAPSNVSIWKKVAGLLDSIRVSLAGTLVVTTTQLPAALTAAGNLKVSITEDGGAVLSVDDNGGSLTIDSPNLDVALSTRLKPADTLAGVTALGSITGALPAGTNLIGQASVPPATLVVTAVSTANAAVTATLPLVAGQFHYISRIVIERIATAAIAGTAVLTYTSTNLNGWARSTGNAAAVGVQNKDVDESLGAELKSQVAATNTTIVAPAAGATGIVRITVYYRAGV